MINVEGLEKKERCWKESFWGGGGERTLLRKPIDDNTCVVEILPLCVMKGNKENEQTKEKEEEEGTGGR